MRLRMRRVRLVLVAHALQLMLSIAHPLMHVSLEVLVFGRMFTPLRHDALLLFCVLAALVLQLPCALIHKLLQLLHFFAARLALFGKESHDLAHLLFHRLEDVHVGHRSAKRLKVSLRVWIVAAATRAEYSLLLRVLSLLLGLVKQFKTATHL